MKRKTTFTILFYCWIIILLTLTSYPKMSLPSNNIIGLDKVAHFIFYLILAYFLCMMNSEKPLKKNLKILLLFMLILPLLDELHQIPIPGRYFSIYDIIADALGIFVIMIIFILFTKKNRTKQQSTID